MSSALPENSASKPPNTDLWQVHYRQQDILRRLDKIDEKLEEMRELPYRVEALERAARERDRTERERAQVSSSQSSFFGESLFVRTIILGLLAAVIGLATGKFAPGLFQ